MRLILGALVIFLLLSLVSTIKASELEDVHCNGFLNQNNEKVYYKLSGKIIKSTKNHYIVKGYSPALNKNVDHKIKKESCSKDLSEFEPKIVKIKEIVEIVPKKEEELIVELEPELETGKLIQSFKIEKEHIEEEKKKKVFDNTEVQIREYKIVNLKDYLNIILK